MKSIIYLQMAAICLTAALSSAVSAAETPFKGKLEGNYTSTFDPGPPSTATLDGTGTGTATKLGRFTYKFPHTVNFGTMPEIGLGTYTFTAANGDTLFAESTGSSTPVEPGIVLVVENAVITGGTGRFSGAQGEFTITRLNINVSGTIFGNSSGITIGFFEGTITSPGGNK